MDLDWGELYINAKGGVNSQWMIFKDLYQKALEESVPRSSGNRRGKSHAIPLDRKTRTQIKRKGRLWSNYRNSGDLAVYKDYCRTRNQVRRITRKKQAEYEKSLAKQVKENPKKFWQYANSKSRGNVGLPHISKTGNEKGEDLTRSDKEKAEVLAEYFSSVYTKEPDTIWELPTREQGLTTLQINLTEEEIKKILTKIRPGTRPRCDPSKNTLWTQGSNMQTTTQNFQDFNGNRRNTRGMETCECYSYSQRGIQINNIKL